MLTDSIHITNPLHFFGSFAERHRDAVDSLLMWLVVLTVIVRLLSALHPEHVPVVTSIAPLALPMLLLLAIVTLALSARLKLNILLVAFCLEALVSTLANRPPEVFHSYERWGAFVVTMALLSPMSEGPWLECVRRQLWQFMIIGLRTFVVVAIIAYPYFAAMSPWFVPCYYGLTISPSTIGMMCALVIIDSVWRLYNSDLNSWQRALYVLLTASAVTVILASASRGAIIACTAGLLPLLWHALSRPRRIIGIIIFLSALGGVYALTDWVVIKGLTFKQSEIVRHDDDVIYARHEHWQARGKEFADSPILGIGFAASTHYSAEYDEEGVDDNGTITRPLEPGSSWLSILSNTGIVGAAIMLAFMVLTLMRTYRLYCCDRSQSLLYGGLLIAFIVNAFTEGWILYAGSIFYLLFWLLLSRIYHLSSLCKS